LLLVFLLLLLAAACYCYWKLPAVVVVAGFDVTAADSIGA
jgi:hypothetical protein